MNETLIVFITGFLSVHSAGGLPDLAAEVDVRYPHVHTLVVRWRQDEGLISFLKTHKYRRIIFVGHSYGVSTGMFVAAKLQHLVKIEHFVSLDGIWRPDADDPSFRSLARNPAKILVPGNVINLHTFRQTKGRIITGHGFQLDQLTTFWVTDRQVKGVTHAKMDRVPEAWELVLKLAGVPVLP